VYGTNLMPESAAIDQSFIIYILHIMGDFKFGVRSGFTVQNVH
jgi:hypothetical protein